MRQCIGQPTRRMRDRSLEQIANDVSDDAPRWRAHLRLAQTPKVLRELDEWLPHRPRAMQLKQWCRETTNFQERPRFGASADLVARIAGNAKR